MEKHKTLSVCDGERSHGTPQCCATVEEVNISNLVTWLELTGQGDANVTILYNRSCRLRLRFVIGYIKLCMLSELKNKKLLPLANYKTQMFSYIQHSMRVWEDNIKMMKKIK